MSGLPPAQLQELRVFVQACQANPDILQSPDMAFFKSWLEEMGAKVPPAKPKAQEQVIDVFFKLYMLIKIISIFSWNKESW